MSSLNREKVIIRTSAIGIIANFALSAFKVTVGVLSNSIAILLDAVNNLTDALSSVVTIIGTKLAEKPADKKHPFGHGRAEYLTALVIAVIILYAGVTSLIESVKKIITPVLPQYAPVALFIVATAVIVKIALGLFVRSRGRKVNSDSLIASGNDALLDSVISISTLFAAGIYLIFNISIEPWLGVLISFVILKSGIETLRQTLSKILGERIEGELAKKLKKSIKETDSEIFGVYDLVLNNYGPSKLLGSVHIEVPDTWNSEKIDFVSRKISAEVYARYNVIMTAVGVYSVNTKTNSAAQIRNQVSKIVHDHEEILQMHGFFVDEEQKIMRFDIIVTFDTPDMHAMFNHVVEDVKNAFPDYDVQVQFDFDISD